MIRVLFLTILCCLAVIIQPSRAGDSKAPESAVYLIPVSGEVDPGMAAFIRRAIRDADNTPDTLFILEIDTFGGRVDAALAIVDTLLRDPRGRTVAYIVNKAISAGALIALACNDLYMAPHTTLGDVAPVSYSSEGPKMMGEKFQSPLRAKFRALAKRNGYPPVLAEAMVTADMEVYRLQGENGEIRYIDARNYEEFSRSKENRGYTKTTVVAAGELLTMDDREAAELGFSRKTVSSLDDLFMALGVAPNRVVRLQPTWSEKLGRLIGGLASILLMIGMAALYTEFKAPGFGLPGIVGIVCLGLVFFNQYLLGLADYTELLIIALGLVLLAFEVFVIPGFGLAGIAGFVLIGLGMILSFQDFVLPNPAMPWQGRLLVNNILRVLISFICALLASLLALRYLLPRMGRLVDGPYLGATLEDARVTASPQESPVAINDIGTVFTPLRPAGKAEINGSPHDVVSQGEFLEKGRRVRVTAITGNRIVVAALEEQ